MRNPRQFNLRLDRGERRQFTEVVDELVISLDVSTFADAFRELSQMGWRAVAVDSKVGLCLFSAAMPYAHEQVPPWACHPLIEGRDRLFVRPGRIVVTRRTDDSSDIPTPLDARVMMNQTEIVLDSRVFGSPFDLIEWIEKRSVGSDRSLRPEFVPAPRNLSASVVLQDIVRSRGGALAYRRKSVGDVVSFSTVPGRFVVNYRPSAAESPTDALESEGFTVRQLDPDRLTAVVDVLPDPEDDRLDASRVAMAASRAARLLKPTDDSVIETVFPVLSDSRGRETFLQPLEIAVGAQSGLGALPVDARLSFLGAIADHIFIVRCDAPENYASVLDSLVNVETIDFAEPVFVDFRPERELVAPSVPVGDARQWNLDAVRARDAWQIEIGLSDVILVVVDMGVDLRIASIKNGTLERGTEDWNYVNGPDRSPDERLVAHGTGVTSLLISGHAPGSYAGLAPGCRILPIKTWRKSVTTTTVASVLSYIRTFAARDKTKRFVVNCSFGITDSESVRGKVRELVADGVVIVASAGNLGQEDVPHFPSDYEGVICVAAVIPGDRFATEYSNFGGRVDLLAPGGEDDDNTNVNNVLLVVPGGGFKLSSGTSFAAPHVAAAAALILSRAKRTGKILSALDVRDLLKRTARNVDALNPEVGGQIGSGVIDIAAALTALDAL